MTVPSFEPSDQTKHSRNENAEQSKVVGAATTGTLKSPLGGHGGKMIAFALARTDAFRNDATTRDLRTP